MDISKRLEKIRSDHDYVVKNYGQRHDFTGSDAENSYFNELLAQPSKKTAYKIYLSMISEVFEVGYECGNTNCHGIPLPIKDDIELQRIANEYLLEGCDFDDED